MATIGSATEIRPFHIDVPEEEPADLRRRIAATRWPEKEPVDDLSQGVQFAAIQALARYWENKLGFFDVKGVTVPTAVGIFPNEIYQAPRAWAEQAFPNLIYFNQVDEGNHFAAWQEPKIFTAEVRARVQVTAQREFVMSSTVETGAT